MDWKHSMIAIEFTYRGNTKILVSHTALSKVILPSHSCLPRDWAGWDWGLLSSEAERLDPNSASCNTSGSCSCPEGLHSPFGSKVLGCWKLTFPDCCKWLTPKSRLVGAKQAIYSLWESCSHDSPVRIVTRKGGLSPDIFTHNVFSVCLVSVCLSVGTVGKSGDSWLFFLLTSGF